MKPFRQAFWLSKNTSGSTVYFLKLQPPTSSTTLLFVILVGVAVAVANIKCAQHKLKTNDAQAEAKGIVKKIVKKTGKEMFYNFCPLAFHLEFWRSSDFLQLPLSPPPAPLFMQPIRERGQLACLLTHNSLRVTFWKNSGADAGTSTGSGNGDGDGEAGSDLGLKTAQRMPNVLRLGLLNDCQAMINCRTNLIKVYGQLHSSTSSPFPHVAHFTPLRISQFLILVHMTCPIYVPPEQGKVEGGRCQLPWLQASKTAVK